MTKENSLDNTPHVFQRNKIKFDFEIKQTIKLTQKQEELIKLTEDKETKIILVKGPAGTAKSYTSIYCALKSLQSRRVSDIIYIRPIVESADTHMGALPGEVQDKISPYAQVLEDKLAELLMRDDIKKIKNDNRVSFVPVSFARGLHWAAKFIVIDEAQSFSRRELVTLMTRIGEFSKVMLCGDVTQSDLKNGERDSFSRLFDLFNDEESKSNGIFCFEFSFGFVF